MIFLLFIASLITTRHATAWLYPSAEGKTKPVQITCKPKVNLIQLSKGNCMREASNRSCSTYAAPAAQPNLCFWMRSNTESRSLPPFKFHLYIRNTETLCLPLLLVTTAVCLVTGQEKSAPIPRALKGWYGCNPAQHRTHTKHQLCFHQGASFLWLIASFV